MTKELDIDNLINMNYRVLTLLGIATSIIMDYEKLAYHDNSAKCKWFMEAISDVVYRNKPIPPLP